MNESQQFLDSHDLLPRGHTDNIYTDAPPACWSTSPSHRPSNEPWSHLGVPVNGNQQVHQVMTAPDQNYNPESSWYLSGGAIGGHALGIGHLEVRSMRCLTSQVEALDEDAIDMPPSNNPIGPPILTVADPAATEPLKLLDEDAIDMLSSNNPIGPPILTVADPAAAEPLKLSELKCRAQGKGRRVHSLSPCGKKEAAAMRKRIACWHCKLMRYKVCDRTRWFRRNTHLTTPVRWGWHM